ncbi:hypothetical protein CBR_g11112 [Chara braunii]|uniref:Uncharacterized protein n=1 Tax=Chara braunii TaxID=69332 RepID=A0A388KQ54_CHABU|nr:hypothetical protein CBR_g11112 [Chara braunii]|eukprot:GBG72179.1 hypothetical protein CBR_g11112 [Chara braunii]
MLHNKSISGSKIKAFRFLGDDPQFKPFRIAFHKVCKELHRMGVGVQVQKVAPLSRTSELQALDSPACSQEDPAGLQRRVVLFLLTRMGLRSGDELLYLRFKDLQRGETYDESGCLRCYWEHKENSSKAHRRGLRGLKIDPQERLRIYDMPWDTQHCPVTAMDRYMNLMRQRGPDFKDEERLLKTPFHIAPAAGWASTTRWYSPRPMGRNTIAKVVKLVTRGETTNWGGRLAYITRLYEAGFHGSGIRQQQPAHLAETVAWSDALAPVPKPPDWGHQQRTRDGRGSCNQLEREGRREEDGSWISSKGGGGSGDEGGGEGGWGGPDGTSSHGQRAPEMDAMEGNGGTSRRLHRRTGEGEGGDGGILRSSASGPAAGRNREDVLSPLRTHQGGAAGSPHRATSSPFQTTCCSPKHAADSPHQASNWPARAFAPCTRDRSGRDSSIVGCSTLSNGYAQARVLLQPPPSSMARSQTTSTSPHPSLRPAEQDLLALGLGLRAESRRSECVLPPPTPPHSQADRRSGQEQQSDRMDAHMICHDKPSSIKAATTEGSPTSQLLSTANSLLALSSLATPSARGPAKNVSTAPFATAAGPRSFQPPAGRTSSSLSPSFSPIAQVLPQPEPRLVSSASLKSQPLAECSPLTPSATFPSVGSPGRSRCSGLASESPASCVINRLWSEPSGAGSSSTLNRNDGLSSFAGKDSPRHRFGISPGDVGGQLPVTSSSTSADNEESQRDVKPSPADIATLLRKIGMTSCPPRWEEGQGGKRCERGRAEEAAPMRRRSTCGSPEGKGATAHGAEVPRTALRSGTEEGASLPLSSNNKAPKSLDLERNASEDAGAAGAVPSTRTLVSSGAGSRTKGGGVMFHQSEARARNRDRDRTGAHVEKEGVLEGERWSRAPSRDEGVDGRSPVPECRSRVAVDAVRGAGGGGGGGGGGGEGGEDGHGPHLRDEAGSGGGGPGMYSSRSGTVSSCNPTATDSSEMQDMMHKMVIGTIEAKIDERKEELKQERERLEILEMKVMAKRRELTGLEGRRAKRKREVEEWTERKVQEAEELERRAKRAREEADEACRSKMRKLREIDMELWEEEERLQKEMVRQELQQTELKSRIDTQQKRLLEMDRDREAVVDKMRHVMEQVVLQHLEGFGT